MLDVQNVTANQAPGLNEATIQAFKQKLRGPLLRSGDSDYDETRKIWNALIDRHPALIVRCTGVVDVIQAVRFAREHSLLVSVRGGGHNVAGYAVCEGGLMLDLSLMRGVWVDAKQRKARVQAGALWGDVDRESQWFGLAVPGGIVSHTGVAGLTLGGGFGWLSRKYGLTCDNLLSVELVTAVGEVVTASATENAELFWALRGGGGNFGVVTSFEFQLHAVGPTVTAGMAIYPFDRAKELMRSFRETAAASPDELQSAAFLRLAPPAPFIPAHLHGRLIVMMMTCYAGSVEDGEAAVRPFKELGDPVVDLIVPKPYVAHQATLDATQPHGRCYYWKSEYMAHLSNEAIDMAIAHVANISSPLSLVAFFQLGGTISRRDVTTTAYGQRSATYLLNIASSWLDPSESDQHIQWTRQIWSAMQPFSTGGGYVNFLSADDGTERVKAAFGADNYARLAAVKAQYDPTNLFRMNQNIAPQASNS